MLRYSPFFLPDNPYLSLLQKSTVSTGETLVPTPIGTPVSYGGNYSFIGREQEIHVHSSVK